MNFIQAIFLQYKIIKKMLIYMNVPFLPMQQSISDPIILNTTTKNL